MTSPAQQGYRWPAEWETHRATWLSWPHNAETWPSGLAPIEAAFCEIVRALIPGERVEIIVTDAVMAQRVLERLGQAGIDSREQVRLHRVPTDDAWIRDYGGIFLTKPAAMLGGSDSTKLVLDFEFDAWGGKYPPWQHDASVAQAMAEVIGVPRFPSPFVLEAGSIDGDGEGTILTTESCLLNSNRNRQGQDRSRKGMEALLAECLGASRVLWLCDGIQGDDTDGHVDDLTRFVAPGRVVTVVESDASDDNFSLLVENQRRLESFRDAAERRLEIVELPSAGVVMGPGGRLPASYANFYIANASVLVPTFGIDADQEALGILGECFPGREVVPVASRNLVEGLGALHCLTQQEPI